MSNSESHLVTAVERVRRGREQVFDYAHTPPSGNLTRNISPWLQEQVDFKLQSPPERNN